MTQNEQSGDASLTPGRTKRGRSAYSWEGKARTLPLPSGEQSGDASLTFGRTKRGRFAYSWEGKAGTLRLLRTGALRQQLIQFRKAGGGTDFIETLINFVSGELSFS
jgi:hypothetical protein